MGQMSVLSSQPRHLERATSFSKLQKKTSLLRRTLSLRSVTKGQKKVVKFSPVAWARCYNSSGECLCVEDEPCQTKQKKYLQPGKR